MVLICAGLNGSYASQSRSLSISASSTPECSHNQYSDTTRALAPVHTSRNPFHMKTQKAIKLYAFSRTNSVKDTRVLQDWQDHQKASSISRTILACFVRWQSLKGLIRVMAWISCQGSHHWTFTTHNERYWILD